MIKRFGIAITAFSLSIAAYADTFKSEADAKQLSERVMAQVAKGELVAAFSLMKPYVVIPESEFQGLALQTKSQRDQFGA